MYSRLAIIAFIIALLLAYAHGELFPKVESLSTTEKVHDD